MRLSGSFICAGERPVGRSGHWKLHNTLRWLGPVPAGWSLAWCGDPSVLVMRYDWRNNWVLFL
jgi:hypothetical protein